MKHWKLLIIILILLAAAALVSYVGNNRETAGGVACDTLGTKEQCEDMPHCQWQQFMGPDCSNEEGEDCVRNFELCTAK